MALEDRLMSISQGGSTRSSKGKKRGPIWPGSQKQQGKQWGDRGRGQGPHVKRRVETGGRGSKSRRQSKNLLSYARKEGRHEAWMSASTKRGKV